MAWMIILLLLVVLLLVVVRAGKDDPARSAQGPLEIGSPVPGPELPGRSDERLKAMLIPWSYVLEMERAARGSLPKTAAALKARLLLVGLPLVVEWFGYDPAAVAAICLHESAYGTSYAAEHYSNLFGVSYYDKALKKWRPLKYADVAGCWLHFVKLMRQSRYKPAEQVRADGRAWINALHDCGYNSSQEWLDGVLAAYAKMKAVL